MLIHLIDAATAVKNLVATAPDGEGLVEGAHAHTATTCRLQQATHSLVASAPPCPKALRAERFPPAPF